MGSYVILFVLGFLTDKIRLFPFLVGLFVGVMLKTFFENSFRFDETREMATNVYETVLSMVPPSSIVPDVSSRRVAKAEL